MIRDVAIGRERAQDLDQKLVTLTVQAEIAFATPADFRAFSEKLSEAVANLAAEYNRPRGGKSRAYRLTCGIYPVVKKSVAEAMAEAHAHDRKRANKSAIEERRIRTASKKETTERES